MTSPNHIPTSFPGADLAPEEKDRLLGLQAMCAPEEGVVVLPDAVKERIGKQLVNAVRPNNGEVAAMVRPHTLPRDGWPEVPHID